MLKHSVEMRGTEPGDNSLWVNTTRLHYNYITFFSHMIGLLALATDTCVYLLVS